MRVRTRLNVRPEVLVRVCHARLPLMPYDDLLEALREASGYWDVEVSGGPPAPSADLPDPGASGAPAVLEALAADPDPRAGLALELARLMDEAGFIRASDPEAAAALRTTPERVAEARRYLEARYGVGWMTLWDWWEAEAADDPEARRVVEALRRAGAETRRAVRQAWRQAGLDPEAAEAVVRRLVRRCGLRPLGGPPGRPAAQARERTPDIEAVVTPGEVSYTVRAPRIRVREAAPEATTVATVVVGRDALEAVRRALLELPERRRRILSAFFELAMEYNREFFAGLRWYRRPVPRSRLRDLGLGAAVSRLYRLAVRINGATHPGYYVLGYSPANRLITWFPLEVLEDVRAREGPGLTAARFREILKAYGIHISRAYAGELLRRGR